VPILRLKDIKDMSTEERANKVSELRAELARLKTMVRAGGAVENPTRIRELRKTIAKILTIENENRLGLRKTEEKTAKRKGKKEKKTK
jgi:large subunit ribosomal protein L29